MRGITILEILLALLLLTLVAGLAIPWWFSKPDVTLDNAAKLLARDLRGVQNTAAWDRRPAAIEFAPDGSGYRAVFEDGTLLPAPIGNGPFVRDYPRDAVFRGVRVLDCTVGEGRAMGYDIRGLARSRGEIVLGYNGETRTVHVEEATGTLSIEGLSEPWSDGDSTR